MFDKIFEFFDRSRKDNNMPCDPCEEEKDAEKLRKRRELERREREATRVNDALEGIVQTIQRDRNDF